jgi:hypothetical protein
MVEAFLLHLCIAAPIPLIASAAITTNFPSVNTIAYLHSVQELDYENHTGEDLIVS